MLKTKLNKKIATNTVYDGIKPHRTYVKSQKPSLKELLFDNFLNGFRSIKQSLLDQI